jgi:hypothetical protein
LEAWDGATPSPLAAPPRTPLHSWFPCLTLLARPLLSRESMGSAPAPPPPAADDSDVDLALRHVTRAHPGELADELLGPCLGEARGEARWLDTQLTQRQRRLDRLLEVPRGNSRTWLHVEWQRRWDPRVPFRVFEYHALAALAAADERLPRPPVESVVLLSGRPQPWPAGLQYRTSPSGAPFSGTRFRMEAVYQQTTAQLLARGLIFALFAPLAVDADQRWLERAASLVAERARDEHDRADLGAAMVVLAEADGQRRGLGPLLLRLLDSELVMQSSIYTMGKEAGLREGLREGEARARREAIEALCEVLSIRLTARRRETLASLDDQGLETLLGALRSGRRWPG